MPNKVCRCSAEIGSDGHGLLTMVKYGDGVEEDVNITWTICADCAVTMKRLLMLLDSQAGQEIASRIEELSSN